MKNNLIVFLSVILISFNSYSQNKTYEAVEYMGNLFESFSEVKVETWKYMKSIAGGKNMKIIDKKRDNLLVALKNQKTEVRKDKGFYSDTELRDAVADYLEMSYKVLNEDFEKILDMEEIAEQSYDLMEAYMTAKEKAGDKLNEALENLKEFETKFAQKYGVTLVLLYNFKTYSRSCSNL